MARFGGDGRYPATLPTRTATPRPTAPVGPTSAAAEAEEEKRKKKRNEKAAEFRFTLTKEEIEADFMALTSAGPPRRPNRRPKPLQCELESAFPASLLPKTIAPDRYGILEGA